MMKVSILWIVIGIVLIYFIYIYLKKRPNLIAFTFDDGPSQYTKILLDELQAREVSVTFFMNGKNGTGGICGIQNGHEALLSRMWEEGHQLANHTNRHHYLNKLTNEQIQKEVATVEDIIFNAIGGDYKCFVRPPYGQTDENVVCNIKSPIVLWNISSNDWQSRNADKVYETILSRATRGSIVLLHDIYETSIYGAIRAIDELKKKGYEFVTVSELMRRTGIKPMDGKIYSKSKFFLKYFPPYNAVKVHVSDGENFKKIITCSSDKDIAIYYTTDGTYPRLSDKIYNGPIEISGDIVFTAVGVDKWGTRTATTVVDVVVSGCCSEKN